MLGPLRMIKARVPGIGTSVCVYRGEEGTPPVATACRRSSSVTILANKNAKLKVREAEVTCRHVPILTFPSFFSCFYFSFSCAFCVSIFVLVFVSLLALFTQLFCCPFFFMFFALFTHAFFAFLFCSHVLTLCLRRPPDPAMTERGRTGQCRHQDGRYHQT